MGKNGSDEVSQARLSRILGRSTRQIRRLEAEGLPHRADGRLKLYPLPEVYRWMEERTRRLAAEAAPKGDLEALKARKLEAEARLAELEVGRQEANLIAIADAEELILQPLAELRSQLLGLPGRIAPVLPCPTLDAIQALEPLMGEILEGLSRHMSEFQADYTKAATNSTPETNKGGRPRGRKNSRPRQKKTGK